MELREKCIICEKPIKRGNVQINLKQVRSKYSVTCSHKCSRIYTRVVKYLMGKKK